VSLTDIFKEKRSLQELVLNVIFSKIHYIEKISVGLFLFLFLVVKKVRQEEPFPLDPSGVLNLWGYIIRAQHFYGGEQVEVCKQ